MKVTPAPIALDSPSLYEVDYLQWLETTLQRLYCQDYATVDWGHLIEELEDMGKRERRSVESNLTKLLLHSLKGQYQSGLRSGRWAGSILDHRRRLQKACRDSPSLKPYLETIAAEAYADACKQAVVETGLPPATLPDSCPYAISQIMDNDFWPLGIGE